MKFEFDTQYHPKPMTFVLAKKDGTKLGVLPAHNIKVNAEFNSFWEVNLSVYRTNEGIVYPLWDEIVDFKLLWLKEFDLWFEIHVQMNDGNVRIKHITAKSLAQSELSQTNLYNIEINTETDIERDDYEPTVFYDSTNPAYSLLNRVLSKTPHYSIKSVPISLQSIQRTFSFNGTSIYDALNEISEEIGCYFDFSIHSDENGKPNRAFKVYDLYSYCPSCHSRGESRKYCEECGSTDIIEGYGDDTKIFVSTENLTDEITFETNEDSVKNCFKLESGDELMDATIVNCNPNGSGYLWYIPEYTRKEMPEKLTAKLASYDELFTYYQKSHVTALTLSKISAYNTLVAKYRSFDSELKNIPTSIVGFPALMNEYYNTIDFNLLLQSGLMPSAETIDTTAKEQAARLTSARLSPVALYSSSYSASTVDSAVLAMAKAQIDYRYQVKIISGSYANDVWTGSFVVTNYYDEEDTANSSVISVSIVSNYGSYVNQMLEKKLSETTDYATDIVTMFNLSGTEFQAELKKYSLARLNAFYQSCEGCLNILIEQGIANRDTWSGLDEDLYNNLYVVYRNKQNYIQSEITLREIEITTITEIQDEIITCRNEIQEALDFEQYLGTDLWLTFIAYRREDTYTNSNYISDGLNNAELFNRALEYIEAAKKDLYRSANLQHSLSATLKNLLVMKEFNGLTDNFELGNYIHVKCDDKIYDVRLLNLEIDFDNLSELSVTFSDVREKGSDINDIKDILSGSQSMATSYDNVAHQAEQGNSSRKQLDGWTTNGLALTALKIVNDANNQDYVFDEHGMLFRKYLPLSNTYGDEQLKIINSTIAITNDNWETVKTAVGAHYYIDPLTNVLTYAYGINGETIIGKIILGEQLGIYNSGATLQFNKNGLTVTNDTTTFTLNPNNTSNILSVKVNDADVLRVSKDGLYITGEIVATSGTIGGLSITNNKLQIGLSDVTGLNDSIGTLNSAISTVEREAKAYADGAVSTLRDTVEANYSTLNSAISTVEREAKAYADGAVSSLTLTTSVNGRSATISMKATDKDGSSVDVTAGTISFDGLVSFSDLSTSGKTTINGSNITTGTVSAKYIDVSGVISAGSASIKKLAAEQIAATSIQASSISIKNSSGYSLFYAGNNTVNIGSFTVGRNSSRAYLYSNNHSSLSDTSYSGVYIGDDGISIRGRDGNNYMNLNVSTGSFEFNGKITATSGYIGDWSINSTYIGSSQTGGSFYITSASDISDYWIRAHNAASGGGSRTFSVSKSGELYASGATISGTITATSGQIGDFTISSGSNGLYSDDLKIVYDRIIFSGYSEDIELIASNYVGYSGGLGLSINKGLNVTGCLSLNTGAPIRVSGKQAPSMAQIKVQTDTLTTRYLLFYCGVLVGISSDKYSGITDYSSSTYSG